jgi:hypothetical protein
VRGVSGRCEYCGTAFEEGRIHYDSQCREYLKAALNHANRECALAARFLVAWEDFANDANARNGDDLTAARSAYREHKR